MTTASLTDPLSLPARPDLTGGRSIGVLLCHGFTGSPVSIRPWAEALAEHGYGVVVPRLPGHGTTWQDCNTTTWEDWYGEVSRAFDQLCLDHDAVVVGGLSMGGALVLRLAAEHPDRVSGVVVVNPAVKLGRKDLAFLPLIKRLVPSVAGIVNDIKKPGVDEGGYTRTPLKALHQMVTGWKPLVADLGRITAPLLYFRSDVDHVVDGLSQPLILQGVSSTDVTVVPLHESYHVATLDNDAPLIFDGTAEFVARVTQR